MAKGGPSSPSKPKSGSRILGPAVRRSLKTYPFVIRHGERRSPQPAQNGMRGGLPQVASSRRPLAEPGGVVNPEPSSGAHARADRINAAG
jgi:hypothetical protein